MIAAGARVALHCEQAAKAKGAGKRCGKQQNDGRPRDIFIAMMLDGF